MEMVLLFQRKKLEGKQWSHSYLATLFSSTSIRQQLNGILKQKSLNILKQNSLHNPSYLRKPTQKYHLGSALHLENLVQSDNTFIK